MKVYLTFDYELFFGSSTGTVDKCMLEPTNDLLRMAQKHNIPLVFFIDACFLKKLKEFSSHKDCLLNYTKVASQLKEMVTHGHEIALHIHPHWEDCVFDGDGWKMNTTRYKLSDFTTTEARSIISSSHTVIKDITGKACKSFRAGGWCIQPFSHFREALLEEDIFTDSSVYHRGKHISGAHTYDFTSAPDKDEWMFSTDCCVEDASGEFKEIPITGDYIMPTFYLNLYARMKLNPAWYKPVGDGMWLKDKYNLYGKFLRPVNHFACADGYFASRLKRILLKLELKNKKNMLVLSHPKSLANCSHQLLEQFVVFAKERGHQFSVLQ